VDSHFYLLPSIIRVQVRVGSKQIANQRTPWGQNIHPRYYLEFVAMARGFSIWKGVKGLRNTIDLM